MTSFSAPSFTSREYSPETNPCIIWEKGHAIENELYFQNYIISKVIGKVFFFFFNLSGVGLLFLDAES